jgi:hypothetical protein
MKRLGTLLLGPNDANQGIYIGDCFQIGDMVPDNSVSLIICDPVYWRMDHYAWLDRFGSRVLIPGGNLIAQCGNIFVRDALSQFRDLDFVWVIVEHLGRGAKVGSRKVVATTKPHVWFCKGFPRNSKWILDWLKSPGKRKRHHVWEDNPIMFRNLIARLVENKDGVSRIVVDPFSGSGTVASVCRELQVPYLAFEIDAQTARMSKDRVADTQDALFGLEQLGFEFPEEEDDV